MAVVITLTYTDAEADRIKAAQEYELGDNTMTNAEHVALYKSKLLKWGRLYVRKQEYKIAVDAVSTPTDIGGT